MIDKVIVKDNILTEDECDFLIDYYQNNPYKIKHKRTRFVRMYGRAKHEFVELEEALFETA